jgi:hypothetical protein
VSLLSRAGTDCLRKLEGAAKQRYAEAQEFQSNRPLIALYLFGYSIEMRLKAAYYRLIGLAGDSPLNNPRDTAEARIKQLIKSGSITTPPVSAGHNIMGWASILEEKRRDLGRDLPSDFCRQMHRHARITAENWSIILRYRANKPTAKELKTVSGAAKWFSQNAGKLWR